MPHKVERWNCDYCKKHYAHKGSATQHEKKCFYNPANKSCASCVHAMFSIYTKAPESMCEITGKAIFQELIANCQHWKEIKWSED